MINYISCLFFFGISLLLSQVKSIGIREARIISFLGWGIAVFSANAKSVGIE